MHGIEAKEEAVRLVGLGKSTYEIGEILGVHHATVSKWARAAGMKRGRGHGSEQKRRTEEAKQRAIDAIGGRFDVMDMRPAMHATLRCRACGHVFERKVDLRYETTCPECRRREVERHVEERAEKLKRERERKATARLMIKAFRAFLGHKAQEAWLDEPHACMECGRTFTMRELREGNPWNYSDKPTFCSLACSRRYHGRATKHRRRERAHAGRCDLSLAQLDERDNHTCYLCGGLTDWKDYKVDADGNFIAGDAYPSIDHVVPLCNGGTHTPDNLRIAHRLCNSLKSNRTAEEARAAIAARLGGVPG